MTETSTLASAIAEVTRSYPVQRIILVADRGLLSVDNLAMLEILDTGTGRGTVEMTLRISSMRSRTRVCFSSPISTPESESLRSLDRRLFLR